MGTGPYGPITQANYLWEFVPDNPGHGPSITDGPGQLINRQSGLCLDVANNNTSDDATIDQWGCNGGANQQWTALAFNGHFILQPQLDGINGDLGVGNGSTCTTSGDGDPVYVRTTGTAGNECDQWDVQQASYDFATHQVTVTSALGAAEVDNRGYQCVPGDKVRPNPDWDGGEEAPWDYTDLSNPHAWAIVGGLTNSGTPPSYLTNGDIEYQKDTTGSPTGQIMLYCDPQNTSP